MVNRSPARNSKESGSDTLNIVQYDMDDYKVSKVDITLEAVEIEDRIVFNLEYCTKLFKKQSIEVFINSFQKIAAAVVENKKIKLKDIDISSNLGKAAPGIYEDAESEFDL
jgi:hypothetical protein